MTHLAATLCLLVSQGEPLPRYVPEDSHGYASLWGIKDAFGERAVRLFVTWNYCWYCWDGYCFDFVGVSK